MRADKKATDQSGQEEDWKRLEQQMHSYREEIKSLLLGIADEKLKGRKKNGKCVRWAEEVLK